MQHASMRTVSLLGSNSRHEDILYLVSNLFPIPSPPLSLSHFFIFDFSSLLIMSAPPLSKLANLLDGWLALHTWRLHTTFHVVGHVSVLARARKK